MNCIRGLAFVFNVGDFLVVAHSLFHRDIKQIQNHVDTQSSAQATFFHSTRDVQLASLARNVQAHRPAKRPSFQHRSWFESLSTIEPLSLKAHILTPKTGIQGCFSARCRSLAPEDRSGRPLDVFLGNRTQHLEKVLTMQKVMHIQKSGCIFM